MFSRENIPGRGKGPKDRKKSDRSTLHFAHIQHGKISEETRIKVLMVVT